MKLKVLVILLLMLGPLAVSAQHKRMKSKDSKAKGTFFGYWGYNRTAYTKSDIRFVGSNYDFTLGNAYAKDNPSKLGSGDYTNFNSLTVPQFNARVGYYFKNHWAISFGYDHMKFVYQDKNKVYLSGYVGPGVDPVTSWEGTYNAEPIITKKEYFEYENSDGLNYLRLELTRSDHLMEIGAKNQFVLTSNVGLAFGGLLSYNDFKFGGLYNQRTISLSGYGVSMHVGPRLEFFRHFFFQSTLAGGFMHQVKVKTRPFDKSAYASHTNGFAQWDNVVGFLLYIRSKNGCNTCPNW